MNALFQLKNFTRIGTFENYLPSILRINICHVFCIQVNNFITTWKYKSEHISVQ